MQDYLSKPLKQNQLIQTILRCATLGGALLEQDRQRMALAQSEKENEKQQQQQQQGQPDRGSQTTPGGTQRRPQIDARGYTETTVAGSQSPKLLAADQQDQADRVSYLIPKSN